MERKPARANPADLESDTRIVHQPARYNGGVAFRIRDFVPEDFETLWRLDQECFAPGIAYSREELNIYIRRRGAFTLVAENLTGEDQAVRLAENHKAENDKESAIIAGKSVAGFIVTQGGTTGHIITIDVAKSARRAGVGSLLLASAEERLQASSASAVTLETAVDNTAALLFYKRHGYNVVRVWPRYYSNGVDALVLTKNL